MTQKPKLEPGDKIRYHYAGSTAFESGTVLEVLFPGEKYEAVKVTGFGCISRRQVTHVLRPKQKPEKERGRIRCRAEIVEGDRSWISAKFFDRGGSQLFPRDTRPAGMEPEGVCLTEMRQGEVVLGREELARAWDIVSAKNHGVSSCFNHLVEALGLGNGDANGI